MSLPARLRARVEYNAPRRVPRWRAVTRGFAFRKESGYFHVHRDGSGPGLPQQGHSDTGPSSRVLDIAASAAVVRT